MTRLVVVDRWDVSDLASVGDVAEFARERQKLDAGLAHGGDLLDDVFFVFLKGAPLLVDDVPASHRVAAALLAELVELPELARLHEETAGDPYAAAVAAARFAPVIAPAVGRLDVDELVGFAVAAEEDGDGEALEAAGGELEAAIAGAMPGAAEWMRGGVEEAAERLEGETQGAGVWGLDRGVLRAMPVAEREELGRQLRSRQVSQVVDLFGRLRSASFARPALAEEGWGEVRDLELGADLAQVVASEWLAFSEAGLDDTFCARLANGELLQLDVVGEDDLALGPIVLCVDGSKSMTHACQGFTRQLWAQAFTLMLLRQAQSQDRPLDLFTFGSRDDIAHVPFPRRESFLPGRVLAAAGAFFGGGTDFLTPLTAAAQLIDGQAGSLADVVFVTDGECWLSERNLQGYREWAQALGVRTWGVLLGRDGKLPFCDVSWTIRELTSGREVGDLMGRVSRMC